MKLLAKVGSLALIAAVAGGVVAGCSSNDVSKQGSAKGSEGPSGMIGLSLQPVSGVTLNSVHFVVTKPGSATPVLEGDLPTPGTAQTFSFGLPLPVGTGYTISLSATSVENAKVTCVGSSTFDVVANVSTAITLPLTCSDTSNGGVKGNVTVKTDLCPRLSVDFVVATPSSQNVPGNIAVAGSAHDLDGKPIQFAWKVSNPAVGTFAPANASTSTFKCVTGSPTPVTLTLTANNGECSKSLTEDVSCVNVTCGNGALDAGEACDPSVPGTTGCLPNCTKRFAATAPSKPPSSNAIRFRPIRATARRPARSVPRFAATPSRKRPKRATPRFRVATRPAMQPATSRSFRSATTGRSLRPKFATFRSAPMTAAVTA